MTDRVAILVVDDEESVRESLGGWLREDGYVVDTVPGGQAALDQLAKKAYAMMLVDLKMPGVDGLQVLAEARKMQPEVVVILMTAYATVDTAVRAMKLGAHDYLVKPFEPEELSQMVEQVIRAQTQRSNHELLRKALKRHIEFQDMVSKSPKMEAVFDLARAAAKSNSTVLILGEPGTGKELLARAIHRESARRDGPFVVVSCAALAENLLELELFGREKEALSASVSSVHGKFEIAAGGTLFLDEIGAVSPKLQMDLLRVLDTRESYRVGGSHAVKTDVRVIAATSRDLKRLMENGQFREDLFLRLNVIRLMLLPLRERKEDIPVLASRFLGLFRAELGKRLDDIHPEALDLLMAHDWPGNVRELRNVLERGAVVAGGPILTQMDLEISPPLGSPTVNPANSLKEAERRHIVASLRRHKWNISQTAKSLGIDRVTLYNKIKRYQIRDDD